MHPELHRLEVQLVQHATVVALDALPRRTRKNAPDGQVCACAEVRTRSSVGLHLFKRPLAFIMVQEKRTIAKIRMTVSGDGTTAVLCRYV